MYYSNDPRFKHLRIEVRKKATKYENILWKHLRAKKFYGYKFRRNHQIGRYYLDFYCHELKLCIEIDGPIHEKQKEYDKIRDSYLEAHGIKTIRFTNSEISTNLETVLEKLKKLLPLSF